MPDNDDNTVNQSENRHFTPIFSIRNKRNGLMNSKPSNSISCSISAFEIFPSSSKTCSGTSVSAELPENQAIKATEKNYCSQSPSDITLFTRRHDEDSQMKDSQMISSANNDVNFMDLSCCSSNQGSPESQIMETDTGILSSNVLGLISPTNLNIAGKYVGSNTSPAVSPNSRTKAKEQYSMKMENILIPSSEAILLSPAESQTIVNISPLDIKYTHTQPNSLDGNHSLSQSGSSQQLRDNIPTTSGDQENANGLHNVSVCAEKVDSNKVQFQNGHSTTFNFEITPPPPCNDIEFQNIVPGDIPSEFLDSSQNGFIGRDPLPDVVPRQGNCHRNAFISSEETNDCENYKHNRSSTLIENDDLLKEEEDLESSSFYIPLPYSASKTMAMPITSPGMIRSPHPPSQSCVADERSSNSDDTNPEFRERRIDDQSTAFPFPSVQPRKYYKYYENGKKAFVESSRSRPSIVRLERHDSTTSSSSGSTNGTCRENYSADEGAKKLGCIKSRKYASNSFGQYHTREGYPKSIGSIKKLNNDINSEDGKLEELEDMAEENMMPLVTINECNAVTASNNTENNIYDNLFNCGSVREEEANNITSPTTPTYSDLPNRPVQITTLPSIPKRSTYRVELQPGEILPERKYFRI